jgi:uncharacterized membrane protein YeaQ/YmgE (transglycosylase-associated protein family)
VNPGPSIILWIIVGAAAGWLASRITGTDGKRGALANVSGVAGALFGSCAVVFSWHALSRRRA